MEAVVSGGTRPRYERSIGIDLSASAVNTAAVELMWDGSRATIVKVWGAGRQPLDDKCLVELLDRSDAKIGVDCPFGWPRDFVALMASESTSETASRGLSYATPKEREKLVYRATDLDVIERTTRRADGYSPARPGVRPLSVSADRIAHVAFRFAGLWARLQANAGAPLDGSGPLVEVYPAAALAQWQAPSYRKYKGKDGQDARAAILDWLSGAVDVTGADLLNLDRYRDDLIASDHVLDALLCALIARDCDLRGPQGLDGHEREAKLEGWIHLPDACPPAHESRA